MPKRFKNFIMWCDENRGKTIMLFIGVVWLIGLGAALVS